MPGSVGVISRRSRHRAAARQAGDVLLAGRDQRTRVGAASVDDFDGAADCCITGPTAFSYDLLAAEKVRAAGVDDFGAAAGGCVTGPTALRGRLGRGREGPSGGRGGFR